VGLSGTILKGTHTGTIPARFGLIWFSGFRGKDETAEPNYTKPGRNGPWVSPFQNCVRQPRPPFKMADVTKIEISSIVHCCFSIFGFIWFSGFRGKDLNVIFYQNTPNLYNRYKSAERKISQKSPEYIYIC
jgi:hypothetical protein